MKTFSSILYGIGKRLDYIKADMKPATKAKLAEYINAAAKLAWEFYTWPDALDIRAETVEAHPTVEGARHIPRVTAQRNLKVVVECYDRDPRVSDCFDTVKYVVRGESIFLPGCDLSTVYVDFRPAEPEFTDEPHALGSAYVTGALVWDDTATGDVFKALQPVPANTALNNAAYWRAVQLPDFLAEPVKAGVIGAFKAAKGEHGTARVKEEYMREALEHEILQFQSQAQQRQTY